MIIRLTILLILIALHCFAESPYYPEPTHSQIKKWWRNEKGKTWGKAENGNRQEEELDIISVESLVLKSGERAFAASVSFPTRARCCNYGILLVRPALQKARQTHSLTRVDKVIYLTDAGFSGVAISGSFMGQGQLSGSNEFLYFDEWIPVVLYTKHFGDDIGSCGRRDYGRSCSSKEVTWFFPDLDGDGTDDLVELIVYREGEEPDQLTWKTRINTYLIKGAELLPVSPRLIQSHVPDSYVR